MEVQLAGEGGGKTNNFCFINHSRSSRSMVYWNNSGCLLYGRPPFCKMHARDINRCDVCKFTKRMNKTCTGTSNQRSFWAYMHKSVWIILKNPINICSIYVSKLFLLKYFPKLYLSYTSLIKLTNINCITFSTIPTPNYGSTVHSHWQFHFVAFNYSHWFSVFFHISDMS